MMKPAQYKGRNVVTLPTLDHTIRLAGHTTQHSPTKEIFIN